LGLLPWVELVTVTVTLQDAPPASAGTVKFKLLSPIVSAGVCVVPTQDPPMAALDTLMLISASVKLRLFSVTVAFGFVMVKVIRLTPPCEMGEVPNALVMVGGEATLRIAVFDTGPAAPLSVDTTPEVALL
jgi:hypothetical protein